MARGAVVLMMVIFGGCTPDDVSPAFGGACVDSSECQAPATTCLPDALTPGGFCTTVCNEDGDCDPSAACAIVPELNGATGVCLLSCRDSRDCEILRVDGQNQAWSCQQKDHVTQGTRFVCFGE